MKIFAVKTFANCLETAKFVKVFTLEIFPLYGTFWTTKQTRRYIMINKDAFHNAQSLVLITFITYYGKE